MPTIEQIRAARALIGWSQGDLAQRADLSQTGIARIENGSNHPNSTTLAKITSAFDEADIEFIGESGVKKRTSEIRTLRGKQGFYLFLEDVCETVKKTGGEICVSNVDERDFDKWILLSNFNYLEKMENLKKLQKFNFNILVCEGDDFTLAKYANYRWTKAGSFGSVSFYVYGNKMALILFNDNDVSIYIINNKEIADAQRKQFRVCWNVSKKL